MCTQKMRALSYIGAEKITFPLNLTDRHTYRRADISVYRVASLLINTSVVVRGVSSVILFLVHFMVRRSLNVNIGQKINKYFVEKLQVY